MRNNRENADVEQRDSEAWNESVRLWQIQVDGVKIDPWLVSVSELKDSLPFHAIEIVMGSKILVHQLVEVGQIVSERDVLSFVIQDIEKWKQTSMEGYLDLARYVINPPSKPKLRVSLPRCLFVKPEIPPQPIVKWLWVYADEIRAVDNQSIYIRGRCQSVNNRI